MSLLYDGIEYRFLIVGKDNGTFGGIPGWLNGSLASVEVPQTFEDPSAVANFLIAGGEFTQFQITTIPTPEPGDFISRWLLHPSGGPSGTIQTALVSFGGAAIDGAFGDLIAEILPEVAFPAMEGRIRIATNPKVFATRAGTSTRTLVFGEEYRAPLLYGYLVPPGDEAYELGEPLKPAPRGYLYTCSRLNQLLGQIKAQLDTKLNKGDNVVERDIVLVDGSIINVPPATEEGDIIPYGTGTD